MNVKECFQYLQQFTSSTKNSGIIAIDEILPLQKLYSESNYYSSNIPRLLMVGEFKSGKSSLMNALLHGEYAATDILEMTSWIARYWPSDLFFCRIMRTDGKEVEVHPDEFKKKCQTREFTNNELSQIARVDIGLPISTMTFSIIDCPGLGSICRENERRMVDALQDADVIVWTVDVDSIGGMRDGTLIKKLLSQGMPYIVVLTKCDLISTSEIEEIKHYLCDEFHLKSQDIFTTSARKALEEVNQNIQISNDTGIPQLDYFLRNDVTTRHGELRKQAENAHNARLYEQAVQVVEKVCGELLIAKDVLEKFKNIAEHMRKAVQGQLEMEVERMVRERMFADHRSAIVKDIEKSLKSNNSSLSQETITKIFKGYLGEQYLDQFWLEISTSMTNSASQLWLDKLKDVQVEIEEICQGFQAASWNMLSVTHSPQAIALYVNDISTEAFSTALKTSLGIASLATVYAAATAQFSLLAATTGVGIPIAAIGAVVSSALFYFERNKSQKAAALEATVLVDSYIKHFIEDILRSQLFPQIAELNTTIEKQMVAGFEKNIKSNLPNGNVDELLNKALKIKNELQVLVGPKLIQ